MNIHKRGSHINCCVYNCHTMKGKDKHLSIHTFPKQKCSYVYITNKMGIQERIDRRKAWEIKLVMGKSITPYMRVCSLHFTKDDFILPDIECKFPRLKKTAVPSQNLPQKSFREKIPKCRKVHEFRKNMAVSEVENADKSSSDIVPQAEGLTASETIAVQSLLQISNVKQFEDKAVQVQSGNIVHLDL